VLTHAACRASLARLANAAMPAGARHVVESSVLPVVEAALAEGWTVDRLARDLTAPLLDLCATAIAAGEYHPEAAEREDLAALLSGALPVQDLRYYFRVLLPSCAPAVARYGFRRFALPLYELARALYRRGRRPEEWLAPLAEWPELTAAHGLEVLLRWWELDRRLSPPERRLKALKWWAKQPVSRVSALLAEQLGSEDVPLLQHLLVRLLAERPDGLNRLKELLKTERRPGVLATMLRELRERESARRLWRACRTNPHLEPLWLRVEATAAPARRVPAPTVLFTFNTRGKVYATPWEEGGILCVACCDRKVYALDAHSGTPLWEFLAPEEVYSGPCGWRGALYFGCHDGKVYALELQTGRKLWDYATDGVIYSSPVVAEGMLYIGSYDTKLYALDARSGALRWAAATGGGVRSTPCVVNQYVLVGSEDWRVYAFHAATGRLIWQTATHGPVRSSPLVVADRAYIGAGDGGFYALDVETGAVRWVFKARAPVDATPCYYRGLLFVASRDWRLYALDEVTGRSRWVFRARDEICASPVVHAGVLYVGARDGRLYGLDAATGRRLWEFATGGHIYSALRLAGGILYVGTHNHRVFALEVEPLPDEDHARAELTHLLRVLDKEGRA